MARRALVVFALLGAAMAFVVSCRKSENCLFSSGRCGGDAEERDAGVEPSPSFPSSDAALDGGCDDGIRYFDAGGGIGDGDADAAPPGARCSAAFECAPIRCICGEGGVGSPEQDASSDADGEAGAADAAATIFAVGVHACVCAVRACATPEEACALGTQYGACAPPPLTP